MKKKGKKKAAAENRNIESRDLDEIEKKPSAYKLPPEYFENENFAKRSRAIKHEKRCSMKKKLNFTMKICVNNMTILCCLIR